MELPPVFLHRRWSWLFWPHLELCWLNVLIGIIRALHEGHSYFALWFSVTISSLWFLFDLPLLNEGDSECEKSLVACRLKDEEEVKNEKERRKEKRGEERRAELKQKDPTSQIAPITGTFRSQCLQKTLAALLKSFPSFALARCVFCFPSFIFLFSFSILSYDPGGLLWWGTGECALTQQLGGPEPALKHWSAQCSWLVKKLLVALQFVWNSNERFSS